jgi:polyvinyl alcohol dehydrogenase (cytochrome)
MTRLVLGKRAFAAAAATATLLVAATAGATDWPTFGGGPSRLFFNADETGITPDNVERLGIKWTFPTGKIVTAAPAIATVDLMGEGPTKLVFVQSWDGNMYALRFDDGTEVWHFQTALQPGSTYPDTSSAHVEDVGGSMRVFFGAGETLYCLDAATGIEQWRFEAGTGCDPFPGLCGFAAERNQIESSPMVADGMVLFGMDVNDVETGKGGFYAVDVDDGHMLWFFDLETGASCTPDPGDDIHRFDGYHTESELGLPAGFLATRSGCDFDRSPTGCGNVWSSPAYDPARQMVYFASSNCDTDDDPMTNKPDPPMPPYDEGLTALNSDGTPAWRWRPREVDNADLAFGAVPQLFESVVDGLPREVVGFGGKDGFYYVIDRDGVNEVSGGAWNDVDPSDLPYWSTQLVPGGAAGGIIGTPAIDVASGLIYAMTAPGDSPADPQQPTVHAMDIDTGAVVWGNTSEDGGFADASFAPAIAIPGLVFGGAVLSGVLRFYDTTSGVKLGSREVGFATAGGAAIADGTVVVGAGVGELNANPNASANVTANIPQNVTALCIIGAPGCPIRLSGRKLVYKDKDGDANRRRMSVASRDKEHTVVPEVGGDDDPTIGGATLRIANPDTGEEQVIALPAANWRAFGVDGTEAKGYKYRDGSQSDGPCKAVRIRAGKSWSAMCKGSGLTFSLDEAQQETLGVTLTVGAAGTYEYCTLFGGTVQRDFGTIAAGNPGLFRAKHAPQAPRCP